MTGLTLLTAIAYVVSLVTLVHTRRNATRLASLDQCDQVVKSLIERVGEIERNVGD